MKQVVGGAFSGFLQKALEQDITRTLIAESKFEHVGAKEELLMIEEATCRLLVKIKPLLQHQITAYLATIAEHLFDPKTRLEWNMVRNNCQRFTDSILRFEAFGGLFDRGFDSATTPSYLMSFVVRPESYNYDSVTTKYDVPNGLTEEYLLKFRSGRHDDADIVDTLEEYWTDWGGFGSHLYPYQDVFPWDCTEAYKTDSIMCGHCDLSKHVWAFPFDTWSIIQLHLQKNRQWYRPELGSTHNRLTDREWMENRFKVLLAQDLLLRGAIAMAETPELLRKSMWWHDSKNPQMDRLKLGGIHRAQPFSHKFERGSLALNYIAPWVHLYRENRVTAYEDLRAARKEKHDVKSNVDPIDGGNADIYAIVIFMILYQVASWTGAGYIMTNSVKIWHTLQKLPELKESPYPSHLFTAERMSYATVSYRHLRPKRHADAIIQAILCIVWLVIRSYCQLSTLGSAPVSRLIGLVVAVTFVPVLAYQSSYIPHDGLRTCKVAAGELLANGKPSLFTVMAVRRNSTPEQVCLLFMQEWISRIFMT